MAIKLSTTIRSNRETQLNTDIGTSAILKIYAGSRPANVATAISSQTLLTSHTCGSSAFGSVSSGVLTANTIADAIVGSSVSSLAPTFFRLFKSDGTTACVDGDVGSSGDLVLSGASTVSTGDTIHVASLTLTAQGA